MKNKYIYPFLFLLLVLVGCEPVENYKELGHAITAEQLDISAVPVIVDGKNSNKIVLVNRSEVLSKWDYGVGVSHKASDSILLVVTGNTDIEFTGLNPDGTFITKTLNVTVDALNFPVAPQWGYLCGSGEKTWIWEGETTGENAWGMGGYLGTDGPAWFGLPAVAIGNNEGMGSKMIFSLNKSSLTIVKSDGTSRSGSFAFDMSKVTNDDNGNAWAIGKFVTKSTTILNGNSPFEGENNAPILEFDIISLNDNKMVLSYAQAGSVAWSPAYFWIFRAQ